MAKKKSTFGADFKKFISRGNVVDMAVGVVVGGAFGKIVTGFVNYVINPFVALFLPAGSLDEIKTVTKEAVVEVVDGVETVVTPEVAILWGEWIQTIIQFFIIALTVFVFVRVIKKMPRWIPGTQCGIPVPVKYILPIRFKLDEHDKKDALPVAEQMPEFPGGMSALMEFLKNEIHYPKKCRVAGVEGRAIIKFVVKKNGKIKKIEVARSSGDEQLDKEAMRVIKKMPKWKPGMHDGKNVNTQFTLPISFKLR